METNELKIEFNKTKRSDMYSVDPRAIIIEQGYNVRSESEMNDESYFELKESIRLIGTTEPLMCRKDENDNMVLVRGHRRLKANLELIAEGLPIEYVKTFLEPKGYNDIQRTIDLYISNSGKPLSDMAFAKVVQRLLNFGKTEAEISRELGVNHVKVNNAIKLLNAPYEVQQLIENKEISATAVTSIIDYTRNPEKQKEIVKEAIEEAKKTGSKATLKHIQNKEIADKFSRKTLLKFLSSLIDEFDSKGIENEKTDAIINMRIELQTELDMSKLADIFK